MSDISNLTSQALAALIAQSGDKDSQLKLESFGFFLDDYVISGGELTTNAVVPNEFSAAEAVVSLSDAIYRQSGETFRVPSASTTYYLDFTVENGFVLNTVHPGTPYLPVWTVNTDSAGNIASTVDNRGAMGFIRFRSEIAGLVPTNVVVDEAHIANNSVSTAKIVDSSVTTLKLANLSVTTAKLADGSVTNIKMATDAIGTANLQDGSVTSAKILDGAVNTAELANLAVTGGKIANNAILTQHISPLQVGTGQLADLSVTTAKLADLGVSTGKLADGAVTNTKLAGNSVGNANLQSNSVDASKIVDGSVGTAELADGSVTALKHATNSVATAHIQALAVDAGKLADNSVATAKIVDGAVTAAKLATNSVAIGNIVDGSVSTAKVADGAVTNAKIATSAVDVSKMAPNSVNTAQLIDLAVTNAKMADNAVNGRVIVDGSVNTAELADLGVTIAKLADGAVTNAKLAVDAVSPSKIQNASIPLGKLDTNSLDTRYALGSAVTSLTTTVNTNETDIESKLATHQTTAAAHAAQNITYAGPVSGATVKAAVDSLDTRVTNIVANSGAANTEVVDARLGADGTSRANLGTLMREIHTQQITANAQTTAVKHGVQAITASGASPLNVTMQGRTLVNLLGKDGGFETNYTNLGWAASGAVGYSPVLTTSPLRSGSYSLKHTSKLTNPASSSYVWKDYTVSLDTTKYYVMMLSVYVESGPGSLEISVRDYGSFSPKYTQNADTSKVGQWQTIYKKIPAGNNLVGSGFRLLVGYGGNSDSVGYTDEARIYEIDSATYNKIDVDPEYTGEKLAEKFPYVDGVKHVVNPAVTKMGKNLLPPFTEWTIHANSVITEPYKLTLNATAAGQRARVSFPALPNTQYTFSGTGTYYADCLDANMTFQLYTNLNTSPKTFTTTANTAFINFYTDNLSAGTFNYANPQFELGSVAAAFEPRNDDYLYLPTTLAGNMDGSTRDQVYHRDGAYRKMKRWVTDVKLDGALGWVPVGEGNGYKRVRAPVAQAPSNPAAATQILQRPDGKPASWFGANPTTGDQYLVYNVDNNAYISVFDSETGWDNNFSPAAVDVQNFFNGWKVTGYTAGTTVTDEPSGLIAANGTYTFVNNPKYRNVSVTKSTDNVTFVTAAEGTDFSINVNAKAFITNITADPLYYKITYTYGVTPNAWTPVDSPRADFAGKVSGSNVENPHVAYSYQSSATGLQAAGSGALAIFGPSSYNSVGKLDGTLIAATTSSNGAQAQHVISFNLIEHVLRKYGSAIFGANVTTVDRVTWLKANLSKISANWYGYGSGPAGNKASIAMWDGGSGWVPAPGSTNLLSTVSKVTAGPYTAGAQINRIDTNGFVHFNAYADASDGVTASTITTDYTDLEVELKVAALPAGYSYLAYTPYTLSYQLATAQEETLTDAEGTISLHSGGNQVEMTENVIVREKVTPVWHSSTNVYYINRSMSSGNTFLSKRSARILKVYKNGVDISKYIIRSVSPDTSINGFDYVSIPNADYDSTVEYHVTYYPLDKYAMTANAVDATGDYNTNAKTVLDTTVKRLADVETTASVNVRSIAELYKRVKALGG